jgi:hypothetical protein
MSPLLFLAIPLVIFVVGSTVLYLGSRVSRGSDSLHRAPEDLQTVAPMVRDQREAGWQAGSGNQDVRS